MNGVDDLLEERDQVASRTEAHYTHQTHETALLQEF